MMGLVQLSFGPWVDPSEVVAIIASSKGDLDCRVTVRFRDGYEIINSRDDGHPGALDTRDKCAAIVKTATFGLRGVG